jgi:G2/mitotic-specific cyclin 3/4
MREGTSIPIPTVTTEIKKELANAKEIVESSWAVEEVEEDARDQLMVAEYEEEIFSYMRELEVCAILPEIFAAHNLLTFFG